MANPLIYNGDPGPIYGNTPFGFYDFDLQFQIDGPKVANYVARKLGYPIMDVELQDLNIYACFEEAISVYAEELYQLTIKDNFINLLGSPTGSPFNNQVIVPNINMIVTLAEAYGTEADVGGYVETYTGSIDLENGKQVYDLQEWGISNNLITNNDRIEVRRIFYQGNPAINQYYDPYIGGSINYQGATENFGWASYSPGLNFTLFPVYWDIQRIQQIEMSNQVRRSAFTFELINNKLRIFPRPEVDGVKLYIQYQKKSEKSNALLTSPYSGSTNLITNPSNVPYSAIEYKTINHPGRQWIFEYTLALATELLGLVRGKYTTVPIPGAEVTLNGADLSSKGREMQNALREKLRTDLTDMSRQAQLERKKSENESMADTLNKIPLMIYIG